MLSLLLNSCGTISLTPEAENLIVFKKAKYVESCIKVGVVTSRSSMTPDPVFTMIGNSNSETHMKNLAAKMGNVLVVTKNKQSILTGSEREGEVYRCPESLVLKFRNAINRIAQD